MKFENAGGLLRTLPPAQPKTPAMLNKLPGLHIRSSEGAFILQDEEQRDGVQGYWLFPRGALIENPPLKWVSTEDLFGFTDGEPNYRCFYLGDPLKKVVEDLTKIEDALEP